MPKGEYIRRNPPAGRKNFRKFCIRPEGISRTDAEVEQALNHLDHQRKFWNRNAQPGARRRLLEDDKVF